MVQCHLIFTQCAHLFTSGINCIIGLLLGRALTMQAISGLRPDSLLLDDFIKHFEVDF